MILFPLLTVKKLSGFFLKGSDDSNDDEVKITLRHWTKNFKLFLCCSHSIKEVVHMGQITLIIQDSH